jgi:hypothetical protein
MGPINLNESRQMVGGAGLQSIQIVSIAMMTGVTGFLGVTIAIALVSAPVPMEHESATLLNFLSLLHAVAACVCYWLAGVAYARALRAPEEETGPADPDVLLGRLRRATVLRLALVEVPAFLGLVICVIAGTRGMLNAEPAYWLNLASAVLFLAFAVLQFPSRSRMEYALSRLSSGAQG